MAKEELVAKEKAVTKQNSDKRKVTFEMDLPDSGDLIVCEVCGHKNHKDAGLCAMCSNYLFN